MANISIRKLLTRLRGETSGNAMLLVAMGAPILIGSTGLAVDTAQWYMWQRELQYAADQAALAGAWARGNGDLGNEYYTRARQEFTANVRIVTNYTTLDDATLADYDTGTDNSVVVTASTTGTLPFANFMLGRSTTVRVNAQAIYETTDEWTACLLALDAHVDNALEFSGGPSVDAGCGVGAISDSGQAVRINGSGGEYNVGWVLSGGGVRDQNGEFGDATIVENMEELYDPYADLSPPDNPIARSLTCGASQASWTADRAENAHTIYAYFKGSTAKSATAFNTYLGAKAAASSSQSILDQTYTSLPTDSTSTVVGDRYQVSGSGPDKVFEEPTTTTTVTYTDIVSVPPSDGALLPGTYQSFDIKCDTTLSGGIYVIDGGILNVNAQYSLNGSGIMFVLKNGAGLQINGGADINLTPMDANQLIAQGVDATQADKLAGMLIFEDRKSSGAKGNSINGNASTNLNGTVYLPRSGITLSGNMHAESECLMIASNTLEIDGAADLTTLCPVDDEHDVVVGSGGTRVRLVA